MQRDCLQSQTRFIAFRDSPDCSHWAKPRKITQFPCCVVNVVSEVGGFLFSRARDCSGNPAGPPQAGRGIAAESPVFRGLGPRKMRPNSEAGVKL
jgi:hypothetical protein